LTLEQGYEAVTIQDITDRASVAYRTYFRHYADKDALLQEVLRDTVVEMRALIGTPVMEEAGTYAPLPPEYGRIIFEHIAAHSDLYRVLLSSGSAALEPLMDYARGEALSILNQLSDPPVPPPILAEHLVATIFALVQWWLAEDMPYSAQEMAVYLATLLAVPDR
jgi:AcrR family transcriptional regulator